MSYEEVSLFPIPGTVAFPFAKIPLHIFEPRYRKMIQDSIASQRRVGVAHTKRVIAEAKVKSSAPLSERLNSNQESYLAHEVFSAGFAQLLETLPDGRLLVHIEMDRRYQFLNEIQSVPYKIVHCQPFEDLGETPGEDLRTELNGILMNLVADQAPELRQLLSSSDWARQTMYEYSFRIYSLIGFEPDLMQRILELRSPTERISFLRDALTRGPLQ